MSPSQKETLPVISTQTAVTVHQPRMNNAILLQKSSVSDYIKMKPYLPYFGTLTPFLWTLCLNKLSLN